MLGLFCVREESHAVGPLFAPGTVYFDRIFAGKCYEDDKGKKWCFGCGVIIINGRKLKAEIQLDMAEMPEYGTPVAVDGEQGFWVFVPDGQGWKIFLDTFVTVDGHEEFNPETSKPWRRLSP